MKDAATAPFGHPKGASVGIGTAADVGEGG
jgi:hypothetical protein